ncbi:V-type ATP synthase subunit I domain-containing protein, partial [Helicobacter pylori]
MQDFINGFLKAWKAWSDDGKDAFLESFLDEVKSSQNDPSNFLGILEQEIKSLSQEGLQDDMSSMLEVIESMKNEISNLKDNENVSDFMNVLQNEISQGQNNSNDNPNEFVESLAQAITEIQENKNELEQQELERKESELESKALQDYEENQIKRAEEISLTEHENELAKQELEKYAIEGENKALEQYDESQNPDTLYEQQVAQEQIEDKEERLLNNQDLELETLRDDNTKQGLDDENLELLESLQIIRDETNEVANSIRANETIELLRPTGENTTSKIASLALEENNKLNEKETNTQEQNTEKEQEKPKIGNDIDFKDKYANLHSFFKQTELDIKQKRIKTKLDFKESFLNYAKNHMNEDELKVLLVVSQKEPTKLTKEHINLIKDCLEQAHGNKHMQDKGLQLSVKSILGHELEKEHHEALKDYMQKSKDSLEPMDNRVYEVMQKHLDKQQEKALKNLDSTTQSVGLNAIKEQNKANENAQQENTKESQVTQQNSTIQAQKEPHADEPWLDYDPKNHAGLKERQENQEKTPSKGNDEPWIEHGKRMQEKAKAHYQAC